MDGMNSDHMTTGRCPRCTVPFDDHWLPVKGQKSGPICKQPRPFGKS